MGIEYQLHKMKRFRDLFTTMCIANNMVRG